MRVSRQKAAENRERIIDAAGTLFRDKGFCGIGVADIMKAAQLTHGGFYGHFASKDDLVAQASQRAMARAAMNWTNVTAGAPKNPYAALLEHYLSPRHRDDPGHGCAFAALSGEAARCGKPVRSAFARGLELHRNHCQGRSGPVENGPTAQGGRRSSGIGGCFDAR